MRSLLASALACLVPMSAAAGPTDIKWKWDPDHLVTDGDAARVYPLHAAQTNLAGRVKLSCRATADGRLENCAVTQEDPANEGFGAAATSLMPLLRIRATTPLSQLLAGGVVNLPYEFSADNLTWAARTTGTSWQQPTPDDIVEAYPSNAARIKLSGSVLLRCIATSSGDLKDCNWLQETPAGEGFGAAAISLARHMKLTQPREGAAAFQSGVVLVPVQFPAAVLTASVQATLPARPSSNGSSSGAFRPPPPYPSPPAQRSSLEITNPSWMQAPSDSDLDRLGRLVGSPGGSAIITCDVSGRGLLDGCRAKMEDPTGADIGQLAVLSAESYQMKPTTADGRPTAGAVVTFPVSFSANRDSERGRDLLHITRWAAAPTQEEVAGAFPREATGRSPRGHVVLGCATGGSGNLFDCVVLTESPAGAGFGTAAKSLSGRFRLLTNTETDQASDLLVLVPIDFSDPTGRQPPADVPDPLWTKSISALAAQNFPRAAAAAGVNEGDVSLECTATHAGALTDCSVAEENPPNFGFGAAAKTIAGSLGVNPWTAQGTPIDGATIRVPIRFLPHPRN